MGKCRDCAYFQLYIDKVVIAHRGGAAGTCACDKFIYHQLGEIPNGSLAYWDYESYAAHFAVTKDFGCIHWLKKAA